MILRDREFQLWFRFSSSGILVIEGDEADSEYSAVAATTYFAALFARSLQDNRVAIPLTFFCSHHAAPGNESEGASGMLQSLCAQLLSYFGDTLDLSFLEYVFTERIKHRNVRALCELLQRLIQAVGISRQVVIVCLLDSVSVLETQARVQELGIAVQALQQLVATLNSIPGSVILKIALAYPTSSNCGRQWFSPEMILTLDDEVIDDDLDDNMMAAELHNSSMGNYLVSYH